MTTTTEGELDLTTENHPLLAHIQLYIFCSIYLITDLRDLTFNKMTACFMDLNKPDTLDTQLAVISALLLSFRKHHLMIAFGLVGLVRRVLR